MLFLKPCFIGVKVIYSLSCGFLQVCQERREREDLQEMVSEDKEVPMGHQVTLFRVEIGHIFTWTLFSSSCRQSAGPPLFSYNFIFILKHIFSDSFFTFRGHSAPVSPIKMTHSSQRPEFTYSACISAPAPSFGQLHCINSLEEPQAYYQFFPFSKKYILSLSKRCAYQKC